MLKNLSWRAFLGPVLLLIMSSSASAQQAPQTFSVDDYFRVLSIADLALSPDGKWIAYTLESHSTNAATSSLVYAEPFGNSPIDEPAKDLVGARRSPGFRRAIYWHFCSR